MRHDYVELALHEHGVARLLDPLAGDVEREQDAPLHVCRRFRRVDVLARFVGADRAAGEGQRLAALVADRDHQALLEEVPAPPQEPCGIGVGERAAAIAKEVGEVVGPRRVAKLELAGRGLGDSPLLEQRAARLSRFGRPEHVLVVLARQSVEVDDPAPQLRALAGDARLLLELDPGPLGQRFQGAPKVGLVDQLHEGEEVAALLAAEAVPGLHLLVQGEAGRLLLVEGTEARELAPALGQADVLGDDVDEVDARLDLVDGVVGPPRRHRWNDTRPRA